MRVACSAMALLLGMAVSCPAAMVSPSVEPVVRLSDRSFTGPRAAWYGEGERLLTLSNNDINAHPSSLLARYHHIEEPADGPLGTLIDGDARYRKLYEQLAAVPSLQLLWNGSPALTYLPTQRNFPRSYTTPTTYGGLGAFSSDAGGAGANHFDPPPPPPPPENPSNELTLIPEPATGMLLGVAGLCLIRRRR